MMERRWVALCDKTACDQVMVVPAPIDGWPDDKPRAGELLSDEGWDVAPNRREAFCPTHAHRELIPYPNGHTHPGFVGCSEAVPTCPKKES